MTFTADPIPDIFEMEDSHRAEKAGPATAPAEASRRHPPARLSQKTLERLSQPLRKRDKIVLPRRVPASEMMKATTAAATTPPPTARKPPTKAPVAASPDNWDDAADIALEEDKAAARKTPSGARTTATVAADGGDDDAPPHRLPMNTSATGLALAPPAVVKSTTASAVRAPPRNPVDLFYLCIRALGQEYFYCTDRNTLITSLVAAIGLPVGGYFVLAGRHTVHHHATPATLSLRTGSQNECVLSYCSPLEILEILSRNDIVVSQATAWTGLLGCLACLVSGSTAGASIGGAAATGGSFSKRRFVDAEDVFDDVQDAPGAGGDGRSRHLWQSPSVNDSDYEEIP